MDTAVAAVLSAIVGGGLGVATYASYARRRQSQSDQKAEALIKEAERKGEKILQKITKKTKVQGCFLATLATKHVCR